MLVRFLSEEERRVDALVNEIGIDVVLRRAHEIAAMDRALLECANARREHDQECISISGMTDDEAFLKGL